ncbi:lambda-exonuclease family protein [Nonomuraea angiospora]|uniref:lambda-exonuclease family protein n=1 Tax=Nonomuraea angiospora TaxID=46172 RepID=UPI0029B20D66|nr:YqaJ viral recombinase family protein [Nonomuraea angiospora]MDX3100509.1 YqaJ viral recombinase family protein [Nonomuraea angiospora]
MTATLEAGTARLLGRFRHGSRNWRQAREGRVGGSTIAGIAGLSPWQSQFSIWCEMAGLVPASKETKAQARGHILESTVRRWFAAQHPEWKVRTAGTYVHQERDYQLANPDALCYQDGALVEGAEFKTDADAAGSGWGRPGNDPNQVPVYYRAQVRWYMDVFGLHRWRVVLLDDRLTFREYVIEHDPVEAAMLRDAAEDFLASLFWDEMPELDDHPATYAAVLKLHPEIDRNASVILPHELAYEYIDAHLGLEVAEKRVKVADAEVAAFMGQARRALWDGYRVARRQLSSARTPYLRPDEKIAGIPIPAPQECAA